MPEISEPEQENGADGRGLWASVANERTALAWNRTAVALAATGAAVLKTFPPLAVPGGRPLVGFSIIALASVIWLTSHMRYRRSREAILAGQMTTPPALIRAFAIAMSVIGIAAFVIALFPR